MGPYRLALGAQVQKDHLDRDRDEHEAFIQKILSKEFVVPIDGYVGKHSF